MLRDGSVGAWAAPVAASARTETEALSSRDIVPHFVRFVKMVLRAGRNVGYTNVSMPLAKASWSPFSRPKRASWRAKVP